MSMPDPMQFKEMTIREMIASVGRGGAEATAAASTLGKTVGVGERMPAVEEEARSALARALESDSPDLREAAKAALAEIEATIGPAQPAPTPTAPPAGPQEARRSPTVLIIAVAVGVGVLLLAVMVWGFATWRSDVASDKTGEAVPLFEAGQQETPAPLSPEQLNTGLPEGHPPLGSGDAAPAETPESQVIPGSKTPFAVGSYKLRITSVTFGSSAFAPSDMAESDTVLTVEVEVVSGDPQVVAQSEGEFDVWITDAAGTKSSARATTSTGTGDSDILAVQWLFGVPQSSRQLYLNFPSGVKVDLTPLLP